MEPVKIDFLIDGNVESEGTKIEQTLNDITQSSKKAVLEARKAVKDQKEIVKGIESDIKSIQKQLNKTPYGNQRKMVQAELNAAKKALAEDKGILNSYEQKVIELSSSHRNLSTEIRLTRDALAKMEEEGLRGTPVYDAMAEKLGKLTNSMNDANIQARILADDHRGIKALTQSVSGLAGGITAATGTLSLFTDENENLAKIQTRLQSLMAVTIGLQQMADAINKDSYSRIILVNKAKQMWAKSQAFLNVQLGIGAVASKTLMTTGIGLLIAGIGALVYKLNQWKKEQEKLNKLQSEFKEAQKKGYQAVKSEVESLENLVRVASNLNEPMKKRQEALNKLNALMPEYNGYLDKETGKLKANKEAMTSYITALANMEIAKELAKKNAERTLKQLESEQREKDIESGKVAPPTKYVATGVVFGGSSAGYAVNQTIVSEEAKEKAHQKNIDEAVKKEQDKRAKLEEEKRKTNELIQKLNSGSVVLLSDLKDNKPTSKNKVYDHEKAINEQLANLRAETTRIRLEQMADGLNKELALIDQKGKDKVDKIKAENQKIVDAYNEQNPTTKVKTLFDIDPTKAQEIANAIKKIEENTEKEKKKARDKHKNNQQKELQKLLDEYKTYEQQKTDVFNKYKKQREKLKEQKYDKKKLDQEEAKELFEIEKRAGNIKSTIALVFSDLSDKTKKELEKIKQQAEGLYNFLKSGTWNAELGAKFGIDEETFIKLKADPKSLDEIAKKIQALTNNSKTFSEHFNTLFKKDAGVEEFSQSLNTVIGKIQAGVQALNMFGDALRSIGEITGDNSLGEIADNISTVTDVANQTMQGIQMGSQLGGQTGAVIGGALGLLTGVLNKSAEAEKRHRDALRRIQQANIEQQQIYNQLLFEQKMIMKDAETIFGINEIAKALNYLEAYNSSFQKLQDKFKNKTRIADFGWFTAEYQSSDLDEIAIKTGHEKTGLFGWGSGRDIYSSITDKYKDLIDANGELNVELAKSLLQSEDFGEGGKEALQEIIRLYEQTQEAQKSFDDYLKNTFGDLGSGMMDSVVEALKSGEDAFESFGKSVGKVMENLGRQMIFNAVLKPFFDDLQSKIKTVYDEGGSIETITSKVGNLLSSNMGQMKDTADIATALGKKYKDELKNKGIDIWNEDSSKNGKKGIQGNFRNMSEDTGSALVGAFNSVRLNIADIIKNDKNIIDEMSKQLALLEAIKNNTAYCKKLEDINDKLENIKINGLKVK